MRLAWRLLVAALLCPAAVLAGTDDAGPPVRFYADLSPEEQSTTTISNGRGRADFSLERATLRLSWRVSWARLTTSVVGAGIHGPQRPGTNAGVQFDMGTRGLAPPLTGSAVLTDAQLQYLLAGRMYVNVRTRKYPDGELRGQIQRLPPAAASAAR
ncbi:MAG: CHRD domain-containing protein [Steroidobacteraceae bacterium]